MPLGSIQRALTATPAVCRAASRARSATVIVGLLGCRPRPRRSHRSVEHLVDGRGVVIEQRRDLAHAEDHPAEAPAARSPGRLEPVGQPVLPAGRPDRGRRLAEHRCDPSTE
jgi:hypothetical protein